MNIKSMVKDNSIPTGLLYNAEVLHSVPALNPNIQPLVLTNNKLEEEKCFNMSAKNIEYCLHPYNTTTNTPFHCYMEEEFVFECDNKTECTGKAQGIWHSIWLRSHTDTLQAHRLSSKVNVLFYHK